MHEVVEQGRLTFGGRGDLTTEVEADETCFASWTVPAEDPLCNRNYWYTWVGCCQRGDLEKLWLAPVLANLTTGT